jgi:hypothetical protein
MPVHLAMRGVLLLVVIAVLGASGCSSTPTGVPIKGQLVWDDGKPVTDANVRFVPVSGRFEAVGLTDKEGAFTLVALGGASGSGVVPGEYKVVVSKTATGPAAPSSKGPPKSPEEMTNMMKDMAVKKGSMPPRILDQIPEIYRSDKTTPLTAKVDSANQKIELKLSKKG